jgi:two-component system, chemotaxis family, sensor kinase CheA
VDETTMSLSAEMLAALQTFVVESRELLQDMESSLLTLESEAEPADTINAIFRAAHTIKGSAGLFGLEPIVSFTHVVESVLDNLRDGKLSVTPALVALLLPCCDQISRLVDNAANGIIEPDAALRATGDGLLQKLRTMTGHVAPAPAARASAGRSAPGATAGAAGNWHVSLRFNPNCLRDGMDPIAFIRYLSGVGQLLRVDTIAETIPSVDEMDPETVYLGFEIALQSNATQKAIEDIFDFVREGSRIHVIAPGSPPSTYVDLLRQLPEGHSCAGPILVRNGLIDQATLDRAFGNATQASEAADSASSSVTADPAPAATDGPRTNRDKRSQEAQSIRVDAARLDRLIDLVGELVIAGAGATTQALRSSDPGLMEATSEVMRFVEEVRDSALQLRMVPIGNTFSRFQRVVRDVSSELGKDIGLVVTGGDTEVDKAVVEKISDPLMHLVRNAMDHGIEAAGVREARGKPAKGTLKLNAYHNSGTIVIEVSDDGGGLNRDRILAKAIERGLVGAGTALSDTEVYSLIFEPGFSTAEKVSNLSGRGVGMDVVKRNITALRGTVEVESMPGQGTTIRIRLPLTLAIIDGFLVGVGSGAYVVPLDRVIECVEMPTDADTRDYMNLRGEVLPFIRLRPYFNAQGSSITRENVVVVEHAGIKSGLVVDRLMGEFQTVIKPLGRLFNHARGIGGSTILGSGEVALILDVPALLQQHAQRELEREPGRVANLN